ncbi:MAG: exodeoxyribonuclease VII small subunit [Clostridia bacterium]|nr:exodeoxyribonuclease VII small subunit [Clostridia bacterium]MBQ7121434.1 exodeoxyribonuclease VII small subunit [Clostridia bacterium]
MEKINYEKSVARLEEITDKLENGNLPLEEMMKLYEEGTALAAKCAKVLDAAQLKITELSAGKAKNDD